MNFEQARFNMIEQQIRTWEVLDNNVLAALAVICREDFVPLAHRVLAFADLEIPLPPHTEPGQCMLSPKVEARMLQDLQVQKHEKVLEIGTGSGYMAALLAHRAQQVLSIEIEPQIAASARIHLQRSGVQNCRVETGDGTAFCSSTDSELLDKKFDENFDVIVLSGSVASVPEALLQRLKIGGRLGAIVGMEPVMRATIITRVDTDAWRKIEPWDTLAPRLLGFPEPSAFVF